MNSIKDLNDIFTNIENEREKLLKEIVKLKQENKNLLTEIESLQRNNDKSNLNERESIFRHFLHKVAKNNGFLVQEFKDYHNLVYCYNRFLQTGFEVNQVGSDTLIIRNK